MGELIVLAVVCGFIYWCYSNIVEWLNGSDNKQIPTQQNSKTAQGNRTSIANKTFDNYKVSIVI